MIRAALIGLAVAIACSAGPAAAQGSASDRSPVHGARAKSPAITTQQGTLTVDKHKAKQRAARRLSNSDKVGAKHASREVRSDRQKGKQSALHVPTARADKTLRKHASRESRSDRLKVKQPGRDTKAAREGKGEAKHAARVVRSERQKAKDSVHAAARPVRINSHGAAHRLAAVDHRKLKQGKKITHGKAKKKAPAVRKQNVRHAKSSRA